MKSLDKDLKILFVDNHLLAVCKPKGMLTQPNQTGAPNLEDLAKAWVKKEYHKKGNVFLHPIHRLDKPVSGIVLFARTSKALSRLNAQMRERAFIKTYLAEVEGHLPEKSGELRHHLVHGSHHARVDPTGKLAHLSFTVVEERPKTTVASVTLHTGRYHQIRAQFAHIGHPILGDAKYGATQSSPHIALHHSELTFNHPISKEKVTLSFPLP
ncbi:RluA family pseudouridine synthase [Candidatus Neptunochlamydia vexilliferae]|uniref:Ribosomal large subunit pseudouridine synthase A n=1 Tax=Candidatus Neptunichlamydia vexilliferae TaxID=1651774 RepID=A0ABS0B089_9BACT|nr:RNA pseudouridine synthase [Candidatus Neptunochlamydia vexilliferae]MBF5059807.1 Ribosomal large subunit pseudouridine synthase A [Candidatus Neptunochlamydia vexilliferae]